MEGARPQLRRHGVRDWLPGWAMLFLLTASAAAQEPSGVSPHGQLALPCVTCHTADGWRPARIGRDFSHARFGFPLQAGHASVTCTGCHTSLDFNKVQGSCSGCHRDVHQGELGTECVQCHSTRTFSDRSTFQQLHALSRFPLEGAHRAVDCVSCHTSRAGVSLAFRGAPTECIGCHRQEFQGTSSPNHPAAGFPTDCTACHTNSSWRTSGFDHNTTQFALTGAHQATTCQSCHGDGVYRGKPVTCISCHQVTFNGTTNPPHQAAGFPTSCTSCHSTTTWVGAVFNHSTTQFPLTGAHQAATCQSCHADGVYDGKPTTCVSCHQTDYSGTTNPAHQSAGFPTTCANCHTTVQWLGATFNHDGAYFPIYSGKHQGKWTSCAQCHSNPASYAQFTCLTCHEHNKTAMDDKHQGRAGYSYQSTACYGCHPRGD